MKHKIRWGFSLLLVWSIPCISSAQEVFSASGGQAFGSDGKIGFSVGQLFASSYEGTEGSIQEGVQQPYEISIVTELSEAKFIDLDFSVYPNPVSEFLFLTINDGLVTDNWVYRLYDRQGNLLQTEHVKEVRKEIQLKSLPPGLYFLKVLKLNQDSLTEVKTFKILKK